MQFNCMDDKEYQLLKDSTLDNMINNLEVLHILNFSEEDFSTTKGMYTQGKQLIFINKFWAIDNLATIGRIYPTSFLLDIGVNTYFSNFQDASINARIFELGAQCFLIVPISGINTRKWTLTTSSINLGLRRRDHRSFSYIGGNRVERMNELFLNKYSISVISVFLYGIELISNNVDKLRDKLNLSMPHIELLNRMSDQIYLYKENTKCLNNTHRYNYALSNLEHIKSIEVSTYEDPHKLFRTKRSHYKDYGYVYYSVLKILWIIQNELAIANIKNEMETLEA